MSPSPLPQLPANLIELPFHLESALERQVAADPEWQTGLEWGVPRPGHPEGQIIWHIREVLANVDRVAPAWPPRPQLRLIALLHDTFKYQVDRSVPRTATNTHEYFARRFAERYIDDPAVLEVLELHDRAFKIHRRMLYSGDPAGGRERAQELIAHLGEHLALFLAFYWCDNATGDKSMQHYEWFVRECSLSTETPPLPVA
jgi:hypothetical protein